MKSGGRWNFRGPRPEEDAAARDAARRSGMSVREWLNSVVKPTEAEDDERRWSADAEDNQAERLISRRRESFRDRNERPRANLSRRDEPPDDPRDDYPQDDSGRTFDRHSERPPRRGGGDQDEPQWQAGARAAEPGLGRRNRKRRFSQAHGR